MAPGNIPPMVFYDGEYAWEAKTRSKSGITNLERPRIICKVKELFKSFYILSKNAHKITQHNNTRNITAIYCSPLNDIICCDILIQPTKARADISYGYCSFFAVLKLVIPPTYIRELPGCDMNSISHSSRIKFPISLIIQHHNILWSIPFQATNPKVMVTYIMVNF